MASSSPIDGLGQRLGQLGLADAGRAEEQEGGDRPAALAQAGAREAHGVAHRLDGLVLADDALVQPLLHLDQPLALLGRQLDHRDAGELRDDLGDVLGAHLGRARAALAPPALRAPSCKLLALGVVLRLQLLAAVELLARARVVLLALELAHLGLEVLHVDRPRRRRDLHPRRRLVDQVDRLVGQEAAR